MQPGTHYFNELDHDCCAALRLEISRGRLPAGVVDQRSITDVTPEDVHGFAHCHFFAGIGGSALAVRLAGWPDDRQLWCGGFPCQDISAAGKGAGIEGSRSGLWFAWLRLIDACRPLRVLVENVPALRTRGADRVLDDLEGLGYACTPVVVGAEHVGAPHRRHRVWIVARLGNASGSARRRHAGAVSGPQAESCGEWFADGHCTERPESSGASCGGEAMADASRHEQRGQGPTERADGQRAWPGGDARAVADANCVTSSGEPQRPFAAKPRCFAGDDAGGRGGRSGDMAHAQSIGRPTEGQRRHAELAGIGSACEIGRTWPARPGQPQHEWEAPRLIELPLGGLVDGLPARLVRARNKSRLKQFGNAWVPQVAAAVLRAWMAAEVAMTESEAA